VRREVEESTGRTVVVRRPGRVLSRAGRQPEVTEAEYLTYEDMLGELHALLGATVAVGVYALVDEEPEPIMAAVGELTRGRATEGLDVGAGAIREGETVTFNLTTDTIIGFTISEATYRAGTRKPNGSLEYRVGDTLVAVKRR
jgi:hypothetical protein